MLLICSRVGFMPNLRMISVKSSLPCLAIVSQKISLSRCLYPKSSSRPFANVDLPVHGNPAKHHTSFSGIVVC